MPDGNPSYERFSTPPPICQSAYGIQLVKINSLAIRFQYLYYLAAMRHRFFLILASFLLCGFASQAQHPKIKPADLKVLRLADDSLKTMGNKMLDDVLPENRLRADSHFTRILVRTLRVPNSFYFSFDSLQTAPVVYPDDSSFRIITWHYTPNDVDYRQRGVIQMNTPDGGLKMFPLYDYSDFTDAPQDSIRTPQNWIGAVYYKIIQKEWQGKNTYTLLGYDEHNFRTTRKWMEMLSFNERGEPRFGGNFAAKPDTARPIQPMPGKRFVMEYKKHASAKLNFDPEEDLIILDHLVSESNEPEKKHTLVPAGDYEYFEWGDGLWVNHPAMYVENRGDNNEPLPAAILGDDGLPDENKLMQQSEKNRNGGKPVEKKPATPVKKKKKG